MLSCVYELHAGAFQALVDICEGAHVRLPRKSLAARLLPEIFAQFVIIVPNHISSSISDTYNELP